VQHYLLVAANVARHSKKTVINSTITVIANLSSFSGPWAYKGSQAATSFQDGQIATLTLMMASIVLYRLLWYGPLPFFLFHKPLAKQRSADLVNCRVWYTYSNRKKEALREQTQGDDPALAFTDMTDRENPVFQYTR
jgi:ACS family allantoate permease-like MFS transporter